MSTVSTMSSLENGSSIRTKLAKIDSRGSSKTTDRDSNQDYKLHCVPKSSKKFNQPKPLPKDDHKATLPNPTQPPPPPNHDSNSEKKFKQNLEGFEKQLKLREATITGALEQKLALDSTAPKRSGPATKPIRSHNGEPDGNLLALYEAAPAEGTQLEDLNLEQYDNSRTNLVRLCKIAYEKGKKDGIADDRKKVKEDSYYRGFKEGNQEGRDEGWKEGYREGYDEGYMKGREYGDKKIEKEINETIAELTQNPEAFLNSPAKTPKHSEITSKPKFNMI